MTFSYHRSYTGNVQGVVLDWSGTTLDYGCFAPTVVFVQLFKEQGVEITMEQARRPMGAYKRDHIAQIMAMPDVAVRWESVHGHLPGDQDVQSLYETFIPRQIDSIVEYADLIPNVKETVDAFHSLGLKVGSCTGYTRAMMEPLLPEAKKRGYNPDAVVCPDEVAGGRPAPWMCYHNAMKLGIYPMESMVKIGDTFIDIAEGLNAGMWTIGLAMTGNELGLTEAEVTALPRESLQTRLTPIYRKMYEAGAHYVIDSLADTLPILDQINTRLARGEKP
jgi:phosphonoacetaldehyde hydrolase